MACKRTLSICSLRHENNKILIDSNRDNICQVCGDKARIVNYGALSCSSCKTFFRRHGFHPKDVLQCDRNGNCSITIESRRNCTACRFVKCLEVGMCPDLIRKEDLSGKGYSSRKLNKKQIVVLQSSMIPSTPSPLNLLDADNSSLSSSNWTLLSNIIHAFDTYSQVSNVRHGIELMNTPNNSLSPNMIDVKKLLIPVYQSLSLSISSSADFRVMTVPEQYSLIKRNIQGVWAFYNLFIVQQCHVFDNPLNRNPLRDLYGHDMVQRIISIAARLDHDATLIKLILIVLAFSSNCYLINGSQTLKQDSLLFGTFRLFGSQNAFVEAMWKYMVYRFGYFESAKRFSNLIKVLLDAINMSKYVYGHCKFHRDLKDEVGAENQLSWIVQNTVNTPLWGRKMFE